MLLGHFGLPLFESWPAIAGYLAPGHSSVFCLSSSDSRHFVSHCSWKWRNASRPGCANEHAGRNESYRAAGLTLATAWEFGCPQRAIRRYLPKRNDLEVLELGCGYRATQLIALEPKLKRGIGVDFQIAPELRTLERFTFHEGPIEETLPKLENETVDVVLLISVLEHLAEPQAALQSAWRLLKPSGLLLINVPTWFGKAIPGVLRFPARP